MTYKIYTMPNCEKCENIKEYLGSVQESYQEVDLGDDEGVAELRKIYVQLKDKIERTEDGQMPIPLFVSSEGDEVKQVGHTLDEVKAIVGK
jgi:glutaredoxin